MTAVGFPTVVGLIAALACPPESSDNPRSGVSEPQPNQAHALFTAATARPAPPDEADDDAPAQTNESRAWIGIQFGPVPEILASHLQTEGGAIVTNVVKNSPADKAGLKRYDVIVRVNNQRVESGEASEFLDRIRDLNPGDEAQLQIVRGGKEQTLSLTVGKRPAHMGDVEYKYEMSPEGGVSRTETVVPRFFEWRNGQLVPPGPQGMQRFQQLFQDKNGNWVLKGTPQGGQQEMSSMIITQSEDGESIEIRRDTNGKFTVTRSDKSGKGGTHTYDSAEEFKKGDPQGYKVYKERKPSASANPFGPGGVPGFQFQFGDPAMERQFREMLDRANRMHGGFGMGESRRADNGTTFQRQPDGSIKVITRQDGDEIVDTYKSANELKRERPDLYKRYSQMRQHKGPAGQNTKAQQHDDDNQDD